MGLKGYKSISPAKKVKKHMTNQHFRDRDTIYSGVSSVSNFIGDKFLISKGYAGSPTFSKNSICISDDDAQSKFMDHIPINTQYISSHNLDEQFDNQGNPLLNLNQKTPVNLKINKKFSVNPSKPRNKQLTTATTSKHHSVAPSFTSSVH